MSTGELTFPSSIIRESVQSEIYDHAQRVVERLLKGRGILALDVDGVFFDGSIERDRFTDPAFAHILPTLDSLLDLRLITARSENVMPAIRSLADQPMTLSGPHIIEEGHAWLMDDEVHPLVPQKYIKFFQALHVDLQNNGLLQSWQKVRNTEGAFCWGDKRWQGRYSGSLWFRYQDYENMQPKLQIMVANLSDDASVPVDCHFNSQPQNDLSWMRISSSEVNKAHRMHTIGLPDIYVCDGPNDRQAVSAMRPDILLPYMNNTNGLIIAVSSSPDKETEDMRWVYENADILIGGYRDLANFFNIVAQSLETVF